MLSMPPRNVVIYSSASRKMRRLGIALGSTVGFLLFANWATTQDEQQRLSIVRRRRIQGEGESSFNFVTYLALEYVNPSVADQLESGDPLNELLDHFCSSVNTQASGSQVQTYAQALSVTIETRSVDTGAGIDYGCSVLATNRVYDQTGEDLFASGVLVLEIAVQQTVYFVGDLSEDQLNNIIESGFNRGDGGRIKFRGLLKENGAFYTLINVEVIEGPLPTSKVETTSSPTELVGTRAPDVRIESLSPTTSSTALLSDRPSSVPSFALASAESDFPTLIPTSMTTTLPPTVRLSGISDKSSTSAFDRRQLLIFGAIAGGIATIFVSCFFIFCVWFPFCGRGKRRLPRPPLHESRDPSAASSLPDSFVDTEIPGTLHLDDDSQSLANITVTIGERKNGRMIRERSMTADSFDESSIYTSTYQGGTPVRFPTNPKAQGIEMHLNDLARVGIVEEESVQVSSASEVESSVASASSLMAGHLELDEETKEEMSRRGTKGFDPFSDDSDSSFGLGESVGISNPSFGTPVKDTARYSPSSTKTKRTDNLVLHVQSDVVSSVDGSTEEGKEEGNSILDHSVSSVRSNVDSVSDIASSTSLANNALLRSVLENARKLERRDGSSRISQKSAPTRVTEGVRSRLKDQKRKESRLGEHISSSRSRDSRGNRRVGARSLASLPEGKQSRASYPSRSVYSPHAPRYNHSSVVSGDLASPFSSGSGDYTNTKLSSHSSDIGASTSSQLFNDCWDGVEEKTNSHVSSPGVLGIASISDGTPSDLEALPDIDRLSYPWLFEGSTETARDPSTNSISSTWSVRSTKSAGSLSTDSIQSWTPKKSNSGKPPLPHGPLSDDKRHAIKSKIPTARTLEHDLSKLGDLPGFRRNGTRTVVSAASGPSSTSIKSAPHRKKDKKQRLSVMAPPGKIGVVLSNRLDGRGTYISEIRPSSSLRNYLRPGDKLVAIDGEDVSTVSVNHITDIMQSKSAQERRLTIITSYTTDEATFHTRS